MLITFNYHHVRRSVTTEEAIKKRIHAIISRGYNVDSITFHFRYETSQNMLVHMQACIPHHRIFNKTLSVRESMVTAHCLNIFTKQLCHGLDQKKSQLLDHMRVKL